MNIDLVSIIIPIYNSENYINRCLDSCFQQSYKHIEVIAINDGSTDNSTKLLDQYATNEKRLKVIHTKNQGVTCARKTGIKYSKGEWVFFLDSDDTIEAYAIEHLIQKAKITNSDIVIGNFKYVNESGNPIRYQINEWNENHYIDNVFLFKATANLWGRLIARKLFDKFSWPDPNIKIGEDIICGLQLLMNSNHIEILNEFIYNYFQYANSTMNSHNPKKIESMVLYMNWLNFTFRSLYNSRYLDHFILNEYYAYLMYGGQNRTITYINDIFNRNKKNVSLKIKLALSPLGHLFINIIRLLK